MAEIFTGAFYSTLQAVLRILIIAVAAGFLVRRGLISQEQVKAVSAILVKVLLPCLIFASIMKQFQPGQMRIWPLLPLAAVAMIALGLLAGMVVFARELPGKKNMLALCGIQNAAYLALPIGSILFAEQFEQFKLYCFIYILGVTPILWSLGKYLISSGADTKISLSELITPPLVANLLAIGLVLTGVRLLVPSLLLDSVEMIGSATVPVAIFVIGTVLGGISFRMRPFMFDAVRVICVKMILVPLCTIGVLYIIDAGASYPLLACFLVIEAASAPATAAVIQLKHYGGDEQQVGSVMLLSYLFCIVAIPFWIAIWKVIAV